MNQNFSAAPNTAAQRVLLLQGVLLLTWTIYALFLPPLAQQAGISKSLIIWILIADQIVFVVMDWIAGVYADRLADVARRIGPVLNVAGVITAVMFAAMPWIASWANPTLFIVFVSIWAASSSFLRVPAFSLLGRMSGNSSKSGAVSWALFGVCMASAVGPLLTSALVKLDPAIPMLVAALVLAIATAVVSRAEPDQRGFMATP